MPRTREEPAVAGSQVIRRTSAYAPFATGMEMVTGTYTGDGNASQPIVGVGFQPLFLIVYCHVNAILSGPALKTLTDGLYTKFHFAGAIQRGYWETDHIISLDADGFTVGDGTGSAFGNYCNVNGRVYTYVAFGGTGSRQITYGTYTGDGNASQPIIGVGFQPRWVHIMRTETDKQWGTDSNKTDQDGSDSHIGVTGNFGYRYQGDHIISLDADGFTVGDGSTWLNAMNILGQEYAYVAVD